MGNIWWRQTKGHGAYTRTNEATNKTIENGSHSKRFWMKHMEEERLSWLVSIFLVSWQYQFSSVAQSRPALCEPMNHSMPGLPVHHQLPEFTERHVHRVSDAIQPSHPLSSPSPPAPNPSSISVFSNESTLRMRWPKYWSFSFSISPPRADLLQNGPVGSPCSPRDSQESSPTPQFKSIHSLALGRSPTLTSIHDYWKNHSLD